jgi:hypothetical protein
MSQERDARLEQMNDRLLEICAMIRSYTAAPNISLLPDEIERLNVAEGEITRARNLINRVGRNRIDRNPTVRQQILRCER